MNLKIVPFVALASAAVAFSPSLPQHRKCKDDVSRRIFLNTIATAPPLLSLVSSSPARAAASQARVEKWPGLQYLEPIYELFLSVNALSKGVQDSSKWPLLKQRLDKFFGGGIISERNYYAGLSIQYNQQIKYDKSELKEYIRLDQEGRINAMENTLKSLEALRDALKEENKDQIQESATLAKQFFQQWFNTIPSDDTKAVAKLFEDTRLADKDRNGKLDKDELATLPSDEQAIWKKRVDLVGE